MANTSADSIVRAREGDVNYFRALSINDLEKSRSGSGSSVLMEAALENHLECCKEICIRSPSLVYHQNAEGITALHLAVWKGRNEIAEFLLYADYYTKAQDDRESAVRGEKIPNKKLLLMVDDHGWTALHIAAKFRNSETARILIEADPSHELLGIADVMKTTALHVAVALQDLEMVKLLVGHKPDFVYYADSNGETPLMTATIMAESGDSNSDIRKFLIQKQESQVKYRTGDDGWMFIHYAAARGDLGSIEDIIRFCPDCLEITDNDGKNFLHHAATNGHFKVVECGLKIRNISENVLNAQDRYENTPLHIAAERGNASTALCLLYDPRVSKTIKNGKGQTAVELITFDYDKYRAGKFRVRDAVNEKVLKDQSDFDLVVCALIATVSFTAGITVPGGFISSGSADQGMAVLSKKKLFQVFIIANTCALLLSLSAVFSHFSTRLMHNWEDIDFQVTMATYYTLGAIFTMVVTFITGSYAVLAISEGLAITVCILSGSFFILATHAMWKVFMQYKKLTSRASTDQQTPTP